MSRDYEKTYNRINWRNKEDAQTTPLGATNLNKMDYSIDEIDNRVITLDTSKAEQSDLLQGINSVTYDEKTGKIRFGRFNGLLALEIDLNIEKIPVSFSLDEKGILTMVTTDGEVYTADIGSLIKEYDFVNPEDAKIQFNKEEKDGKIIVSAELVKGSISGEYLEPNYLADVTTQASVSKSSSESSQASATQSMSYAVGGTGTRQGEDTDNARYYYNKMKEVVAIDIATTEKAGIVKPDVATMQILADGTLKPIVDSAISKSSTNPVQNKAIWKYVGDSVQSGVDVCLGEIEPIKDNLTSENNIPFQFGYDEETESYGFYTDGERGADSFIPFSSGSLSYDNVIQGMQKFTSAGTTITLEKAPKLILFVTGASAPNLYGGFHAFVPNPQKECIRTVSNVITKAQTRYIAGTPSYTFKIISVSDDYLTYRVGGTQNYVLTYMAFY